MTAGSSAVATRGARARFGPPPEWSDDEAAPPEVPADTTEPWKERLFGALPLLIVGGACLAIAVDLYFMGTTTDFGTNGSVHLYPWALFFALAVTGLAAGIFAWFLEEEPSAPAGAAPVGGESKEELPAWDESTLPPEKPLYLRPRTWEQYPGSPVDRGFESVPPDVVLNQLDEIEESLRKKPRPPDPD